MKTIFFVNRRIWTQVHKGIIGRRFLHNSLVNRFSDSLEGKEKKVISGRQGVLNSILSELKLKLSLDSTPINNDTQMEIERFTKLQFLDFSNEKQNIQRNVKIFKEINLDMFNPNINKIIIESLDKFVEYLDVFKTGLSNELLLLSETKKPTEDEINKTKYIINSLRLLNHTSTDVLARYCVSHYLRIVSGIKNNDFSFCGYLNSSTKLTIFITESYYYSLYNDANNNNSLRYSEWFNNLDEEHKFSKDNLFNIFLGQRLCDIYTKVGLLVMKTSSSTELLLSRDKEGVEYVWDVPDNIKDILDYNVITSIPSRLPMLVKPKPFSDNKLGGYLSNDVSEMDSLLIDKVGYKTCSKIKNNTIYDIVNKISQTGYKINTELLEFLEDDERAKDWGLLIKDDNIEIDNTDNKYARKEKKVLISKLNVEKNILTIADIFKKHTIYFPVRLDNRGRLYCTPHYLNYQSTELAKALLLFSIPGEIVVNKNADYYFKIYGANCFGEDKKSINQRLTWVQKNLDNILNYENGILVKKANKKLLFLAFCMEYRSYINSLNRGDKVFKTHLPIQLDATCNGFQHLSMLSNETKLFKELNLIKSSTSENPGDFYNYILHLLITNINNTIESESTSMDVEKLDSYKRLSKFILTRSIIKKALMVIPYNAGKRTIRMYVKEALIFDHFEEIHDHDLDIELKKVDTPKKKSSKKVPDSKNKSTKKVRDTKYISWWRNNKYPENIISNKDIMLCVDLIHSIIEVEFTQIKRLIQYLNSVVKLCNGLDIHISWNLPHGLEVRQGYLLQHTERIPLVSYNKKRITIKYTDNVNLDKKKQVTSLMPNLIHSLDAASLMLLCEKFFNIHKNKASIFTVHDCFATTSDKVTNLLVILRSIYTKLYSQEPYLRKFDEKIIEDILSSYRHEIEWDCSERKIKYKNNIYEIHSVDWVYGYKQVAKTRVANINRQKFHFDLNESEYILN